MKSLNLVAVGSWLPWSYMVKLPYVAEAASKFWFRWKHFFHIYSSGTFFASTSMFSTEKQKTHMQHISNCSLNATSLLYRLFQTSGIFTSSLLTWAAFIQNSTPTPSLATIFLCLCVFFLWLSSKIPKPIFLTHHHKCFPSRLCTSNERGPKMWEVEGSCCMDHPVTFNSLHFPLVSPSFPSFSQNFP